MAVTFCSPQIAKVGKSHKELSESGAEFSVGKVSFEGQGRALVMAANKGLLHVYGNRDGELLGAEMIGPHVEHLAHLLAWAIEAEVPLKKILTFPVYHPVVEEGLRTALRDLARKTGHGYPLELAPAD